MAIRNWARAAAPWPIGLGSDGARRRKLPQAKMAVAASTSQGSRRAKKLAGVAKSSSAPTTPPARLITKSARNESRSAPDTILRPARPVVTWPGKRAMVEVMLAARASIPARISAGKVTNEPPPASAFWTPAQRPAARSSNHIGPRMARRSSDGKANLAGRPASGVVRGHRLEQFLGHVGAMDAGHVAKADHADRGVAAVEHRDAPHLGGLHRVQRAADLVTGAAGDDVARHQLAHRGPRRVLALGDGADDNVAVGDDPDEVAVVHDGHRADVQVAHGLRHLRDPCVRSHRG